MTERREKLAKIFLAEFTRELMDNELASYNISPGRGILAICESRDTGRRTGEILHWGLVPSWAKDPEIAYKMINARSETAHQKPAFKDALRYRRCLIPANGFYEWDRSRMPRQPYYFYPAKDPVFAFAGLWEYWQSADGSEILSAAVLTTHANQLMSTIHHRQPVILSKTQWDHWLNPSEERIDIWQSWLEPIAEDSMQCYPVSIRVNNAREDGPELIAKTPIEGGKQMDLF